MDDYERIVADRSAEREAALAVSRYKEQERDHRVTLHDLLNKFTWPQVWMRLEELYQGYVDCSNTLEQDWIDLAIKTEPVPDPTAGNLEISVKTVTTDAFDDPIPEEDHWVSVDGIRWLTAEQAAIEFSIKNAKAGNYGYAISYRPREYLLMYPISTASLKAFSELDLLVHIFAEI